MCNKIEFIPHFDPFPQLDTLNLSFNNIKVNGIPLLSQLKKLSHLDLSSNNLTNLPEDLSQFKSLRELRLSGNLFSTDSLIHKAS